MTPTMAAVTVKPAVLAVAGKPIMFIQSGATTGVAEVPTVTSKDLVIRPYVP